MRDDTEVDAVAAVGQSGLKVAGLVEGVCWESRCSVVKVFSWFGGKRLLVLFFMDFS